MDGATSAGETGWRVGGKAHWLWCFANAENVFYLIDRSRRSQALAKFFTRAFEGTLITDFWSPYEASFAPKKRDEVSTDHNEWESFSRRLVGVYRDAKKLHHLRAKMSADAYDMSVAWLETRIGALSNETWDHPDASRLAKRLNKHGERAIRPAVLIRKNSNCNHSDRGALTQSVLMSLLRTLRVRGHQPLDTVLSSLAEYSRTSLLPPKNKPAV